MTCIIRMKLRYFMLFCMTLCSLLKKSAKLRSGNTLNLNKFWIIIMWWHEYFCCNAPFFVLIHWIFFALSVDVIFYHIKADVCHISLARNLCAPEIPIINSSIMWKSQTDNAKNIQREEKKHRSVESDVFSKYKQNNFNEKG